MKILTFGEIMLRLQPFGYKRFMQAEAYEAVYGGGEANVAVSLAQLGADAAFITRLPENAIADKCIKELRGWGVDTSRILRGGGRMGIYFCEKGAGYRLLKTARRSGLAALYGHNPRAWRKRRRRHA